MERRRLLRAQNVWQRGAGYNAGRIVTGRSAFTMAVMSLTASLVTPPGNLRNSLLIMGIYHGYRFMSCHYGNRIQPPICHRQHRIIHHYEPAVFRNKFRFHKAHALAVFNCLGFRYDEDIVCENRTRCNSEEAFLIFLARMKSYERFTDLQDEFGLDYSQLCRIFNTTLSMVVARNRHLLFDNFDYFSTRFEQYNRAIRDKVGRPLPAAAVDTALFCDGKSLRISRPGEPFQSRVYNGHHRVHCLQFQGVSAPDGMIVDFYGPLPGIRHDQAMFRSSQVNQRLAASQEGYMLQFKTYSDKGYVTSSHGNVAYRGRNLPDELVQANRRMSSQRIGVEWAFGKISQNSAFVDQYKVHKIQLSAVAKVYYAAAILANFHTCLYMSNASVYWNVAPPTLGNYCNQPDYDITPINYE